MKHRGSRELSVPAASDAGDVRPVDPDYSRRVREVGIVPVVRCASQVARRAERSLQNYRFADATNQWVSTCSTHPTSNPGLNYRLGTTTTFRTSLMKPSCSELISAGSAFTAVIVCAGVTETFRLTASRRRRWVATTADAVQGQSRRLRLAVKRLNRRRSQYKSCVARRIGHISASMADLLLCLAAVIFPAMPAIAGLASERPNILWISCEDISPQLGCYGDPAAVRAKRWTYDTGSRVPLIVRIPERFRNPAEAGDPGSVDDRMVNLIDLGPTVLTLAGTVTPAHMHGQPFLGPSRGPGRELIFGARDRLDERFDMVRTVRSRDFRYVRNLMPWRPALQAVAYGEQNAILKEMRRLLAANELAPASAQWFAVPRAAEELYDLNADPWELANLAARPEHQETLRRLGEECDRWQLSVRDTHLLPEIMLDEAERSGGNRWQILQEPEGRERTLQLLAAAKETARLDPASAAQTATDLSDDPAVRWWQVTRMARAQHPELRLETLMAESKHAHPAIRIAAAAGLARGGQPAVAAEILGTALQNDSEFVRHAAILEVDEAGSAVIELLDSEIAAAGDGEYVKRLMIHATGP